MATFSERTPPQSLEAEQSVLGAMLIDREAVIQVAALCTADDFYDPQHQLIYRTMLTLSNQGRPVDLVTLSADLRRTGQLESVGGMGYLSSLCDGVPTTANVESYALIVQHKAVLRRLQQAARQIIEDAYEAEQLEDVLGRAEAAIFDVTQRRVGKGYEHIRDALYAAYDHIEMLYNRKGGTTGVPSGFKDLDTMTSGWQPSDLIIIAARPSVGKTAFTLNLARNAAIHAGKTVAFFSLEMAKEQIALRLLSSEAVVDQHRLRTGQILDEDWQRLSTALSRLAQANILIDDTPNIPLHELRSRARRIQAEYGLDMIIIDYLQLMNARGSGGARSGDNRTQEVAELSRTLKALARELRCPVIALSQLSRAVEQRQDKRPLLSDLRESGAIEQDADVVMFLYRDDYYDPDSEKKNICEVSLAKQRNGPVGTVELVFMKEIGKFMAVDRRHSH